jgi:hypothetical protein
MTDLIAAYTAFDRRRQVEFLIRVAHRLTVIAREDIRDLTWGMADLTKPRTINEAQHRIMGQLLKLRINDRQRYPDAVFASILKDYFAVLNIDPADMLKLMDRSPQRAEAK